MPWHRIILIRNCLIGTRIFFFFNFIFFKYGKIHFFKVFTNKFRCQSIIWTIYECKYLASERLFPVNENNIVFFFHFLFKFFLCKYNCNVRGGRRTLISLLSEPNFSRPRYLLWCKIFCVFVEKSIYAVKKKNVLSLLPVRMTRLLRNSNLLNVLVFVFYQRDYFSQKMSYS